jgi:2-polyprenyl-6-methoxyphenol hydroxylase-like FAD-dependent oxidoreductase
MCEALGAAASAAGAQLKRGVDATVVEAGRSPTVRYRHDGAEHATTCRLVVGAEGWDSGVRRRAGVTLHTSEPRLIGAGLLVDDLSGWPSHQLSIGTEGDVVFFVLPQGSRRARLYLMYSADQRGRFTGPTASRTFLDSFRFACMPDSECVVEAKPAGPCAAYPMNDTWTDPPIVEGIALIGDAAGHSDPHGGQGLSVALRDVRILSEILLAGEDWSAAALQPYAEERAERMRRLRFCTAAVGKLRGEFDAEGRERRRRLHARMRVDPELALWRRAMLAGPESVPASAFTDQAWDRLWAAAATPSA